MGRHLAITHTHTHTGNKSLMSYPLHIPWPVLPDVHVSSFCNPSSAHASLLACVLSAALSQWTLYGWLRSYWLHDHGSHLSYWPARWNISTSLQPLMSEPQNIHTYTWTKKVLYEGWNFNFGNAAVTFDTAHLQSSYFHRPSMYSQKLCRTRSQWWGSRMMSLAAPVLLMVRTERSTAEGLNPPCNCPIR